jgi:hypothetical protein
MVLFRLYSVIEKWWKQNLPYLSDWSLQGRELEITINSDRQRRFFYRYQRFADERIGLLRMVKAVIGLGGLVISAQWVIAGFPISPTSVIKLPIVVMILSFSAAEFMNIRATAVVGFPGFRKTNKGIFEVFLPCLECGSGTTYIPDIDKNPPKYCANCENDLSVELLGDDEVLYHMMEELDKGEDCQIQMGLYNSSETEALVKYPNGEIHPIVGAENIEIKEVEVAGSEIIIGLTLSNESVKSIQDTGLHLDIVLSLKDNEWNIGLLERNRGLVGTIGPKEEYDRFIKLILDAGLFYLELYTESGELKSRQSKELSEIDLGKLRQLRNHSEYA